MHDGAKLLSQIAVPVSNFQHFTGFTQVAVEIPYFKVGTYVCIDIGKILVFLVPIDVNALITVLPSNLWFLLTVTSVKLEPAASTERFQKVLTCCNLVKIVLYVNRNAIQYISCHNIWDNGTLRG